MVKVLNFFLPVLFLFLFQPGHIRADSTILYPTDDFMAQLYDNDGVSDWTSARNFQGEIYREPIGVNFDNDTGKIFVRSDNGTGVYRIYRVSKKFDLSSLPNDVEVTSARVALYKTDSNNNGAAKVVITSHERVGDGGMQKEDWKIQHFGNIEFSRAALASDGYTVLDLNEAGLDYIRDHIGGEMTLGFLTDFDFDNIEPVSRIESVGWHEVEEVGVERDPYLYIEFEETSDYPLYTQIESPYPSEAETADWSDDQMPCGTIAECGCTMTSAVMLARSYGVATGVDGTDINPKNFNNWLKENGGYNNWGELNFVQALKYFAPPGSSGSSYFSFDADRLSDSETRSELSSRPIITEVLARNRNSNASFNHFLLSTNISDGDVLVNDPLWYNTANLNDDRDRDSWVQAYSDRLVSGRDISYSGEALNTTASLHITLGSPAELLLNVPSRGKLGVDPRNGSVFDIEDGQYATSTPKANVNRADDEYHEYKKIDVTNISDDQLTLEVIGTDEGAFTLDIGIQTQAGEWSQVVINGNTSEGKSDVYAIDMASGEVSDVNSDITREQFIELVENATADFGPHKQRFYVKYAHRIFNAIDADRNRLARLRLRIFTKLLKIKRVDDEPLNQGIDQVWSQLR